jgi:hypothetical protein
VPSSYRFPTAPKLLSETRHETNQHRNDFASDCATEFCAFQAGLRKFLAGTACLRCQRLYPANPISGHADPA